MQASNSWRNERMKKSVSVIRPLVINIVILGIRMRIRATVIMLILMLILSWQ